MIVIARSHAQIKRIYLRCTTTLKIMDVLVHPALEPEMTCAVKLTAIYPKPSSIVIYT